MKALAHDNKSFYRPDIDGLRAIAVLAVVLFHIEPALLPGGFAGVDIFFVISGYLITGNISRDFYSPQGFSWREFYRRRALRILPVLFVVLLVTLLVGHFTLLPEDLDELGRSALASVFSVANIYFAYFLDVGYFADDSSLQPLLHLWSLGVEEQFYFIWPVILVFLLARFARGGALSVTALLIVASFILAELSLSRSPMFTYYMLPTRAGELLIGALLALFLSRTRSSMPAWFYFSLGLVGALLVIASLAWVTEDMGFPGVNALPSTLGAALLIWAGSQKVVGISRILSLRPLVLVGLISYSLYLWHWPILSFYRYIYGVVEPLAGMMLFGVMVAFSVASYRWVEKPCRKISWSFNRVITRLVVVNTVVISGISAAIWLSGGLGFYSFDSQYQTKLKALSPAPAAFSYPYVCQRPLLTDNELQSSACVINPKKPPSVLLWGDSHAAHYVGMLGAFAEKEGFSFRNAAHSSCPPLLAGAERTQRSDLLPKCISSIDTVRQYLGNYSTVILAASWVSYFDRSDSFLDDLEATLRLLGGQGKSIIILGQVPNFKAMNRKCPQVALKLPIVACDTHSAASNSRVSQVNSKLIELASRYPGVHYFDVRDYLCHLQQCSPYLDGRLVYFDASHLSMEGSWLIGWNIVDRYGVPSIFSGL